MSSKSSERLLEAREMAASSWIEVLPPPSIIETAAEKLQSLLAMVKTIVEARIKGKAAQETMGIIVGKANGVDRHRSERSTPTAASRRSAAEIRHPWMILRTQMILTDPHIGRRSETGGNRRRRLGKKSVGMAEKGGASSLSMD